MIERLRRALLLSMMAVVGLNIWTGNPLLALWVGSRVVGSGPPTMGAIAVVALMIGVVGLALTRLLAAIGAAYDRATGHEPAARRHVPWLRSMRGERIQHERERIGLSALEILLVAMVLAAVVGFEVWFFFYSSSPIDQRSGRD
jgi:hypothetical protein